MESSRPLEPKYRQKITNVFIAPFQWNKSYMKICKISILYYTDAYMGDSFSHLFNQCMLHGIFPESYKIGRIVLILKKGNSKLVSIYRPISILPVLSKSEHRQINMWVNDSGITFDVLSIAQRCCALK